jgi:hypothetical protein
MTQAIAGISGSKPRLAKPSGGSGKIDRRESHALDVEYRKQRNQQLQLKNAREQLALEAFARHSDREKDGHTLSGDFAVCF